MKPRIRTGDRAARGSDDAERSFRATASRRSPLRVGRDARRYLECSALHAIRDRSHLASPPPGGRASIMIGGVQVSASRNRPAAGSSMITRRSLVSMAPAAISAPARSHAQTVSWIAYSYVPAATLAPAKVFQEIIARVAKETNNGLRDQVPSRRLAFDQGHRHHHGGRRQCHPARRRRLPAGQRADHRHPAPAHADHQRPRSSRRRWRS